MDEPDPGIRWGDMPADDDIMAARKTIRKMHHAIYPAASDPDFEEVWGGLVEAGRMVAVATSWLSNFDLAYGDLWTRMMKDDDET